MNNKLFMAAVMAVAALATAGCQEQEPDSMAAPPPPLGETDGVFVVNEGAFNFSNSSLSFYDVNRKRMLLNIFYAANLRPLGDVAQSMNKIDGHFYVVVNNSQKIEVLDGSDLTGLAIINGVGSPRYVISTGAGKAYASDWSTNSVKILSTGTHTVTGSIAAGSGPDQMLMTGGKVYVLNSGGWGDDSTVTVIDAGTDAVLNTLEVGRNPNSLAEDANGKIWILCGGSLGPDFTGGTADDVAGSLWRIHPGNDSTEAVFPMAMADHPLKLAVNGPRTSLYYLLGSSSYDGMVFRFGVNDMTLPAVPLVSRTFYGLGVDPMDETIYGGFSPSFTQEGYVFRYKNSGTLLDSNKTGIGPNGFYFNY